MVWKKLQHVRVWIIYATCFSLCKKRAGWGCGRKQHPSTWMWAVCSLRSSCVSPWRGALSSQPSLWGEGAPHRLWGWGYSRVCHSLPLVTDIPACCNNGTRKWALLQQLLMHWCSSCPSSALSQEVCVGSFPPPTCLEKGRMSSPGWQWGWCCLGQLCQGRAAGFRALLQ